MEHEVLSFEFIMQNLTMNFTIMAIKSNDSATTKKLAIFSNKLSSLHHKVEFLLDVRFLSIKTSLSTGEKN